MMCWYRALTLKLCDIEYAKELGYTIKLLAVAKHDEEKGITVCVRPTMLPTEHPLAGVNDVFNAVFVEGDALGEAMFMGRGAGGKRCVRRYYRRGAQYGAWFYRAH